MGVVDGVDSIGGGLPVAGLDHIIYIYNVYLNLYMQILLYSIVSVSHHFFMAQRTLQ